MSGGGGTLELLDIHAESPWIQSLPALISALMCSPPTTSADLADYGRHRRRFPHRPSADKTDGRVLRSEVERPRLGSKRGGKKTRTRTRTTAPLDNAKQKGRHALHIPFHHVLLRKRSEGRLTLKPFNWIREADGFTVPFHKLHLGS